MTRQHLALLVTLVAALAACGSTPTENCLGGPCSSAGGAAGSGGESGVGAADACDKTPKTGDYPCDVFKVVHDNCHVCHQDPPKNGAPFSLLQYADTQVPYSTKRQVFQQMYHQIQPDAAPRMPLNGMLTVAEQKTLGDWLAACAPPEPAGMGCGCPGTGCD